MRWLPVAVIAFCFGCVDKPTEKAHAKKEPTKMTTRVKDCREKGEQIQVEQRVVIDDLDSLNKSLDMLEDKLKEKKHGR